MNRKKAMATLFAILAAVFYAINMPCSKLLLRTVPSTLMAGFLYLGAGVFIGTCGCRLLGIGKQLYPENILEKCL